MTDAPVLQTERLILRAPAARDLEAFVAFCTSPRAEESGNRMPRADAWRMFASVIGHWTLRGFGMWTVTRRGDDASIGLIGGLQLDNWPEREIAWFLWEGHEGQGYAAEAARAALDHSFGELGWPTAVSYIDESNTRSIALAERLGARRDPDAAVPDPAQPVGVWRHPGIQGGA